MAEALRANRHDHVFLEIDRGISVFATVDDVHHRNRKFLGIRAADVAIKRQTAVLSGGFGHGKGNTEHGVGAKIALGIGAIERDHRFVDFDLVAAIHSDDFRSDYFVNILNSF